MSKINEMPNKGKGGRKNTFSDSFKVQVALEYLNGDYSCPQVAKKYDLTAKSVEWFVSWYRKNHQQLMAEEPEETEDSLLSSKDIKALEKKLALAELKIAALEKVIAIANEDYRTDLKKKAATR
jgi:transposase-like protein